VSVVSEVAESITALGVFIGAAGLWAQARQRKLALTQLYVQRFWQLDDLMRDAHSDDIRDSGYWEAYLRLCEDEYEIAHLGWIELSVWEVWHAAIRDSLVRSGTAKFTQKYLGECHSAPDHAGLRCAALQEATRARRVAWWFEHVLTW
jgi:hypothetical protein